MTVSKTETKAATRVIKRRDFTRFAVGALGVALAPAALSSTARAGHHEGAEDRAPTLVTDVESNTLLLSQVKYVPVSELDGKRCGNCALLLEREGEYGRCGLFQQGKVPVSAWCTSWIQKPGT
jgi:hypothetical protein